MNIYIRTYCPKPDAIQLKPEAQGEFEDITVGCLNVSPQRMSVHVAGIPEVMMITTEKQEPEKDGLHCTEQENSFKIVFM